MAMSQLSSSLSASRQRNCGSPRHSSNSKKRHYLVLRRNAQHGEEEDEDIASVSASAHKPDSDRPETSTRSSVVNNMRENSVLSQPPYPECGDPSTAAHAPHTCSAIGSFLQHLKQSTAMESIEFVTDNSYGACGKVEPVGASPKQGRLPRMSAAQKKNVRWDTHSSTYKVAAAAAAAAAVSKHEGGASQLESYVQSLGGSAVPSESVAAPQRRSSAAAPTCPRRRTSKEDCLSSVVDDEINSDSGTQDYKEEVRKLREQIAQEEALLQSVAAAVDKTSSPQKPERRSSLLSLDDLSALQAEVLLFKLLEEDDQIASLDDDLCRTQTQSPDELPSFTTQNQRHFRFETRSSMGHLPDYKMALNAVTQRYAVRPLKNPGGLSSFRSSSKGVFPSATASVSSCSASSNDRPLGIPRRRESADIVTLCVLDEASSITESQRKAVV